MAKAKKPISASPPNKRSRKLIAALTVGLLCMVAVVSYVSGQRGIFNTISPDTTQPATTQSTINAMDTALEIQRATNEYRSAKQLWPLVVDGKLCHQARELLRNIGQGDPYGGFNKKSLQLIAEHGGIQTLAINLATEMPDVNQLMSQWKNDSKTRINLEGASDVQCVVCEVNKNNANLFDCAQLMTGKTNPTSTPRPAAAKQNTQAQTTQDTGEWGKAVKKEDGSYTMRVGQDDQMATPSEIYQALLAYRQTKGKSGLSWDDRLAGYALERAVYICENGRDSHAGFRDFLDNQGGYDKLGYAHLGENMGSMKLSGVHLIEWMYSQSPGHDANQLGDYSHVGIGVSGTCNVVIFGGAKL